MYLCVVLICFTLWGFEMQKYGRECGIRATIEYLAEQGIITIDDDE